MLATMEATARRNGTRPSYLNEQRHRVRGYREVLELRG